MLYDRIETPGGGLIIFQGMQDQNAESIKSLEGYNIAWVRGGTDAVQPQPCALASHHPRRRLGDLVLAGTRGASRMRSTSSCGLSGRTMPSSPARRVAYA